MIWGFKIKKVGGRVMMMILEGGRDRTSEDWCFHIFPTPSKITFAWMVFSGPILGVGLTCNLLHMIIIFSPLIYYLFIQMIHIFFI